MTKLQTSLVTEETWVDGAAEKLSALPTATSALELDVSIILTVGLHKKSHANRIQNQFFLEIFGFYFKIGNS